MLSSRAVNCLAPQQQSFCLNAQSHPQFTPQLRVPGRLTVNKGLVMGWGWGWPLKKNKMIPWNGLKVKNECFQAVIYIDGQWWDLIMWSSETKLHWQTICFLLSNINFGWQMLTLNEILLLLLLLLLMKVINCFLTCCLCQYVDIAAHAMDSGAEAQQPPHAHKRQCNHLQLKSCSGGLILIFRVISFQISEFFNWETLA